MVDIPIDSSCSVELTDAENAGEISDGCKTKLDGRRSNFCGRYKCIILAVMGSILLIEILLRLMFFVMFVYNVDNAAVSIQPKSRVDREWAVRLYHPLDGGSETRTENVIDGDSSLADQTGLAGLITGTAAGDTFPTINGERAGTRSKRDVREASRARREHCIESAAHCKSLLQTVQNYLLALNNNRSKGNTASINKDILDCLRCKNLQSIIESEKESAPQSKDQYFPHGYAVQNSSGDSGITLFKLLDDGGAESSTRQTEVNRTEATEFQTASADSALNDTSQDPAKQSTKNVEVTAVSADRVSSDGSRQGRMNASGINQSSTVSVNDKQPDGDAIASNSRMTKIHGDDGTSAASNVDRQQNATAESKGAPGLAVQLATTESSEAITRSDNATTQYNTITKDDAISGSTAIATDAAESSETSTWRLVDAANQTAITENVTGVPAGYDVTGIGGTTSPSPHPPSEGHPESQSANVAGSRSMADHRASVLDVDRSRFMDSIKPPLTAESSKSYQQLQMWTMPQPVCFWGNPSQIFGRPSPSGPAFNPDSFPSQNHGYQSPLQKDSSQPNYVQIQANTVQFMPRSERMDVGPTGPSAPAMSGVPIFSLNQDPTATAQQSTGMFQQPTGMLQQPIAGMPYFCAYMTMPALRFPPISGISQPGRSSADKAEDLPEESRKLFGKDTITWQEYPIISDYLSLQKCPKSHYQCNNLRCVPKIKWCDGYVDCADASDETKCSCRDRISRERLCDGYFDCPHGEDELGCFNCPVDTFSCDDWDKRYSRENCVPLSQRCDGIYQCTNGKDELNCNILSESYMNVKDVFTVGFTRGYLHKNVQGQWYPVCSNESSWAIDACQAESSEPITTIPDMQIIRFPENVFQGPFAKESNGQIELIQDARCSNTAVFVTCPSLTCGTRVLSRQDSSSGSNVTTSYMYKRHVDEQSRSETAKFNQLYHETLGLLDANSTPEKEVRDDFNDTLIGSQSRVVGGRTSQPTAWPFLVAIYKDGHFHCGGVILRESYILTAAHCMDGYEGHYYEVQAGMLRQFSFSPMAQWRKVRYVIIHPDYESRNMQNDIAVIMLDEPLLFNRWVRQVCLPELITAGPEWKEGPSPLSTCIAIGWGAIREYGPDADHLREVEVPILSWCKHLSDQNSATICAGYPEGGRDACQGDSGGPLMCRNPNSQSQWYVAGIISHGEGCARPNEPGVYMKVSYFVDWIQQLIAIMGDSTVSEKPLDSCPGFSCHEGRCLPKEKRCDRIVNCLDGEDEVQCDAQVDYIQQWNSIGVRSHTDKESNDTESQTDIPEAIPVSPSFHETATENNEYSNTASADETTPEIMSSVRLTFTCQRLIQTITINKRCDRRLDCEDGTDEDDCTCRDYLLNSEPTAICDGHVDCADETDETNCGICQDDEFYCSRSAGCIPMSKRCNAEYDCPLKEDELDCLALTDGTFVYLDSDNRPVLNMDGLLTRHHNGSWQTQCLSPEMWSNNTITSTIGRNLCVYLGFSNMQSADVVVVNKTAQKTGYWRYNPAASSDSSDYEMEWLSRAAASEEGEACTTLSIRCRPVLSSSADSHLIVDTRTKSRTYLWPWLAAIFVDGRYRCSALLLEPDWLLSSSSCTGDIRLSVNYTTALLGRSRSYLYVDGPYQQIHVVDEIRDVKTSDASLLHLKTAVDITRYTQPLFLEKKIYPPAINDLCVAVGTDKERVTQSVFLQPVLENCDKCYRCFVKPSGSECPVNTSDWSGTVFCRSEAGWYPAAVFHENNGLCSSSSMQNLTSIDYIHAYITQAMEKQLQPIPEATCNGARCNIGQCVPWNQVCDGMADCRDGEDETYAMCIRLTLQTKNDEQQTDRKCEKSMLRCTNGDCISKGAFCDGKVDCADGTDEPAMCNCAEYLKLTQPGRLCDGVRHCLDKTDESPEMCNCTENSFKCNAESGNLTCISQDFVCDGDNDCPNGEDEAQCIKLKDSADGPSAGEVVQRSYGVWHSQCYLSPLTSEQAKSACQKMNYTDGVIDYENVTSSEPIVPSRDDFYMVRLNSNMWVTMRDDKPLITLVRPVESCYRLFVKCK